MDLKTMKVQKVKGSCFVYIPKFCLKLMEINKGDKVVWSVHKDDLRTLHLKKKIQEDKICQKN